MTTATDELPPLISAPVAASLLGYKTARPVKRLAAAGHLAVHRLPGRQTRYYLGSVLEAAAAAATPAKESHGPS